MNHVMPFKIPHTSQITEAAGIWKTSSHTSAMEYTLLKLHTFIQKYY